MIGSRGGPGGSFSRLLDFSVKMATRVVADAAINKPVPLERIRVIAMVGCEEKRRRKARLKRSLSFRTPPSISGDKG